ncbi:MAG: helix-turn-helix transcriptional regulator [Terriglobia bacterium]|nr:helix-turn-helix transcriptional regulator [Terriglobia bacterium]
MSGGNSLQISGKIFGDSHPAVRWRKRQGWGNPERLGQPAINQEEAAERCGLHRTYYSGIERGVRNVSLVNIEKAAKGLKTTLPDLFRRV